MSAAPRRPNILLITSDQQRGDCYGFEGRKVKTPHLDALAREGTRFAACITPNVVCQPSRASILTGLLPLTHGVHDNGIDLEPAVGEAGFAGALARNGYRTAFIGKAHFSTYNTHAPTGTPECLESAARYPADWTGPYMGFQHVELMLLGHNWWVPSHPPRSQAYERWYYADGRGEERNALLMDGHPGTVAAQTWPSKLPVAWHNSTWVGDRTVEFVKAHRDRPWCLWASIPDPHHPFDAPEPWCRLHHPDEIDLPRHRVRDFERRPWWHRAAIENEPSAGRFSEIRKSYSRIAPQTDAQLRALIANYYGMISLIDHTVGRILIALHESGQADNTYVVFTSDHGDWLGDHGLILKGPMHYEGLLRVGLIVRGPTVPAAKIVADPVSTLCLASTFLDWSGTTPLRPPQGHTLAPVIVGRESRDYAYNEWELLPSRAGVALSLRTVRTRTHKLTIDGQSGAGELYDLVHDPDEMENRFGDPGTAAVQRELVDMIRARPIERIDGVRRQVGTA